MFPFSSFSLLVISLLSYKCASSHKLDCCALVSKPETETESGQSSRGWFRGEKMETIETIVQTQCVWFLSESHESAIPL